MNKSILTVAAFLLATTAPSVFACGTCGHVTTCLRDTSVVLIAPGPCARSNALLVRQVKRSDFHNNLAKEHRFRATNGRLYEAVGNLRAFHRADSDSDGIVTAREARNAGLRLGFVNANGCIDVTKATCPLACNTAKILVYQR